MLNHQYFAFYLSVLRPRRHGLDLHRLIEVLDDLVLVLVHVGEDLLQGVGHLAALSTETAKQIMQKLLISWRFFKWVEKELLEEGNMRRRRR